MNTAEQSGIDEHMVQFEVEAYRRFTEEDVVNGTLAGVSGMVGGATLDLIIFGVPHDNMPPDPSIPEDSQPVSHSVARPRLTRQIAQLSPVTLARPTAAQPEARALVGHPSSQPSSEFQFGFIVGIGLVAALATVAIKSALRKRATHRKVNFKADMNQAELDALYDLPDALNGD